MIYDFNVKSNEKRDCETQKIQPVFLQTNHIQITKNG